MEQEYRILVTGGCGFIGWNFLKLLFKESPLNFTKVINMDMLNYAATNPTHEPYYDERYEFVRGNITSDTVYKILNKHKINLIVHFAAQTHVCNSIEGPRPFLDSNIFGTYNLLEEARYFWNDEPQKDCRFVHVSCYDKDTRAWTTDGFKNYWELKEGDSVLSINPDTKLIETKKIQKVIVQDYEGDMIHFKDKKTDILVTPNHRMYFQNKGTIEFDEAQNIIDSNEIYFPRGNWKGVSSDVFDVEGVGPVPTHDLFYVCGMFAGDGFTSVQEKKILSKSGLIKNEYIKKGRDPITGRFLKIPSEDKGSEEYVYCISNRIFFDVPEKDKGRQRLEQSLTNLGIKWIAHKNKSGEHIYFSSKEWVTFLNQFGHGFKNKHIPNWMMQYDSSYLNALFDGLIDSDGHYTPSGTPVFSTSSPKLRDDICQLAIKLGMSPRFLIRNPEYTSKYKDRIIKSTTPAYIIHFRAADIKIPAKDVIRVPYKGKIWCVKVEDNKNLVVERNGILQICGNTDEVYGSVEDQGGRAFTEETPYHPNNPYSASKAAADHIAKAYFNTYNFPVIVTNCSNNYGPGQHTEKLIPKIIDSCLNWEPIPLHGDGTNKRDWIFVDDHCKGIIRAILTGKNGESYLFGTHKNLTNLSICDIICSYFNERRPRESSYHGLKTFVAPRPGYDNTYLIDYSKARKELDWNPIVPVEYGLVYTIEEYIKNYEKSQ